MHLQFHSRHPSEHEIIAGRLELLKGFEVVVLSAHVGALGRTIGRRCGPCIRRGFDSSFDVTIIFLDEAGLRWRRVGSNVWRI